MIKRKFVSNAGTAAKESQNLIRVISYNILAQSLLHNSINKVYLKLAKQKFFSWNYRKRLILKNILDHKPDIICTQEFEKGSIDKEMEKEGYCFTFCIRNNKEDGCMIAWKEPDFKLIKKYFIRFNTNDGSNIYCKNNVGLFVILEKNDTLFLVCCTHILYNRTRGDIKVGQIYQLMKCIDEITKKEKIKNVLLTGDFNSTHLSAIYEFVTKGSINLNEYSIKTLSGQELCYYDKKTYNRLVKNLKGEISLKNKEKTEESENLKISKEILEYSPVIDENKEEIILVKKEIKEKEEVDTNLKNEIPLKSCYHQIIQEGNSLEENENAISNPIVSYYSQDYAGTFDYIFYSDSLTPKQVLGLPDIKQFISKTTVLPNKNIPSDHFMLVADFYL